MDKDEILRLKQITGLAALFSEADFSQAWISADDEVAGDGARQENTVIFDALEE